MWEPCPSWYALFCARGHVKREPNAKPKRVDWDELIVCGFAIGLAALPKLKSLQLIAKPED